MTKSTLRTIIDNIETGVTTVKNTVSSYVEPAAKFVKKILTVDGLIELPELVSAYSTIETLKTSKAYMKADNATRLEMLTAFGTMQQTNQSSESSFIDMPNQQTANYDLGTSAAKLRVDPSSNTLAELIKNNVLNEGQSLTENFAKHNEFLNFASAFNGSPDLDKDDKSQPTIKLGS